MADQPQKKQEGGGPKMEACPKCSNPNKPTQPFCGKCGVKLEAECPKCQKKQRAIEAYCTACGTEMKAKVKQGGVNKWCIEVSYAGAKGQYDIHCQMTKDGSGVSGEIAVLGFHVGDIVDGKTLDSPSFSQETTEKGVLRFQIQFTGRKRQLTMRINGCQANTDRLVVLSGAPFTPSPGLGFWKTVKKVIEYNRS